MAAFLPFSRHHPWESPLFARLPVWLFRWRCLSPFVSPVCPGLFVRQPARRQANATSGLWPMERLKAVSRLAHRRWNEPTRARNCCVLRFRARRCKDVPLLPLCRATRWTAAELRAAASASFRLVNRCRYRSPLPTIRLSHFSGDTVKKLGGTILLPNKLDSLREGSWLIDIQSDECWSVRGGLINRCNWTKHDKWACQRRIKNLGLPRGEKKGV